MPSVSLAVDGIDGLRRLQAVSNPTRYQRAITAGVRYASNAVPRQVGKSISTRYNIPSRRVKEDVSGPRIYGDTAEIRFSTKAPTLNQYGFKPGSRGGPQPGRGRGKGWGKPRPPGRPATAAILRGERQAYPTTFLAPARGGQELPMRQGKGVTRFGRRKLQVVYGPSIGRIFAGRTDRGEQIRQETKQLIEKQYIKGFERAIKASQRGF